MIGREGLWRATVLNPARRKACRFFFRSRLRYCGPILQYMHQQPLIAPGLPNSSSRAGQRSGVSRQMVSFMVLCHTLIGVGCWLQASRLGDDWPSDPGSLTIYFNN